MTGPPYLPVSRSFHAANENRARGFRFNGIARLFALLVNGIKVLDPRS